MQLYLIRHTTPKIEKGICYGQTNLGLVETFRKEAETVIFQLPEYFDAVYASPLKRCWELAKLISDDLITDHRLKEIHFGDWEMQPWEAIPEEELNLWMENYFTLAPPNGESMQDLENRVRDFWEEIKAKKYYQVAIVTHGGVIKIFNGLINKLPKTQWMDFRVNYGEVVQFVC